MIDKTLLYTNPEFIKNAANSKGITINIDEILDKDTQRKDLVSQLDNLRARQKQASKVKVENPEEIEELRSQRKKIKELELRVLATEKELEILLNKIPNPPAQDVKIGQDESANEVVKEVGQLPKFSFTPKDHLSLGEKLQIIDVKRAVKISGARFAYLEGGAALLEFALIRFALDKLMSQDFIPVIPPVLIRQKITRGLGYWEAGGHEDYYLVYDPVCPNCNQNLGREALKKAGLWDITKKQVNKNYSESIWSRVERGEVPLTSILLMCPKCKFRLDPEEYPGFYLAGTAEHAVVPMHQGEVLDLEDRPKRYAAFSTCFRREAGSYGKDTRGIMRVHQFDKLEMVSFTTEENDQKEHGFFLSLEEELFSALGIPYRVIKMGSGDLGFPIARKYDIEAWMPGQNAYKEVTSTSTTTDFQSRRLNIKYSSGKDKKYARIINGTAFAIGRTIIAIVENYQNADGSITVPEVLRSYMHGVDVIR